MISITCGHIVGTVRCVVVRVWRRYGVRSPALVALNGKYDRIARGYSWASAAGYSCTAVLTDPEPDPVAVDYLVFLFVRYYTAQD